MKNPFQQKMPLGTDIKIRLRILKEQIRANLALGAGLLLVPALALWLFVFVGGAEVQIDNEQLVLEIRQAQAQELAYATNNIYHVTRIITEGADKPAYVKEVVGESGEVVPRMDVIETYQHSETALALIESNGTQRPFEAFLSREHENGELSLHHFGESEAQIPQTRKAYDQAHDLASLYTSYTSLETPSVPVLSETAEFVKIDEEKRVAIFKTVASSAITIESFVDLETKQLIEEVIYVASETGNKYEMTRVAYVDREIISPDRFEEVFDPNKYTYTVIDSRVEV